mgnify:FL=1
MNKKILAILAAVSGIALQTETMAAQNQGGFTGPSIEVITVEQAKNMNDDAFVILRGNIKQNVGDDIYVFTDGTGSINVEIDEDEWNGLNVGPEDVVEIRGEVDKGWSTLEIDVDRISKVNQ